MDDTQLGLHAAVLVGALLLTAAVQLGAVRFSGGRVGVVMSLFVGFAAGFAALVAGEAVLFVRLSADAADSIGLGLANVVLFTCCWYFYFHFINIGEASLRIRVLREAAAKAEGATMQDLLSAYNVNVVVETRTARLLQDGQLVARGGRFHAGRPRMVFVARVFSLARWTLLGPEAARRFNEPFDMKTSAKRTHR